MDKPIDLRSDTVTRPSPEMRRAVVEAEVGDDVFGEDPSVNRLQDKAAKLLGKEAALFVPSGTMANQVCLRLLTQPGDEVICDAGSHCYRYEGGAGAALSGLSFYPLAGDQGRLSPEQVAGAIQGDNIHYPISRVVALENTHNRGNGSVYRLEAIQAIAALARERGLKLHLDGARLFNACLAGGYSPPALAEPFETVSFCLSKGLGAPVGSMVVTSRRNLPRALRIRKQLGGAMRQAGLLAAAGLYALERNLDRLVDDHRRAKRLAESLAGMRDVKLDPDRIETNIVIFDVSPSGKSSAQVRDELARAGVLVLPFGPTTLRAVLHLDVNDADLEAALKGFSRVLNS